MCLLDVLSWTNCLFCTCFQVAHGWWQVQIRLFYPYWNSSSRRPDVLISWSTLLRLLLVVRLSTLKICDSSGIANWGWWRRLCLRTLNGFTHKPVFLTMLANEQHCQIHARKKANLRAISSQKRINITQYSSILHDTWCNIEFGITQYYIVKHTILPNITWNLM